jgi:hypothetical protein
MTDRWKFSCGIGLLAICSIPLLGQVLPVPIPGGDIIPPTLYINQFLPGVGPGFDGMNADPHGITNFNGLVAMGYGVGTATDSTGRSYLAITDVRVYQGEYIGGEPNGGAGRTRSKRAHATFVEI